MKSSLPDLRSAIDETIQIQGIEKEIKEQWKAAGKHPGPETLQLVNFYKKKLKQLSRTVSYIENRISTVPDEQAKEILIKCYKDGKTLEEIAEDIGYSFRQINRLKAKAVELYDNMEV